MTDPAAQPMPPKIAQLEDGTQIHFPGHVADAHMDEVVKRHLGLAPSSSSKALLQTFHDALEQHLAQTDNAPSGGMTPHDRDQLAKHRAASLDVQKAGHLMGQRNNQELIAAIAPMLKAIAANGPAVIKAINALTQTIAEIGRAHIEIAGGDRELITDEKTGKPKKLRINRRK